MPRSYLHVLFAVLALGACRKEKIEIPEPPKPTTTELSHGVPSDADSIHGYFYAANNYTRMVGYSNLQARTLVAFADPANSLGDFVQRRSYQQWSIDLKSPANLSMGEVYYNQFRLNMPQNWNPKPFVYSLEMSTSDSLNHRAYWQVTGTEFFAPFEQMISGEFPEFRDSIITHYLFTNKAFSINVNGYFDRWDSVAVVLSSSGVYSPNYFIFKVAGNSSGTVTFSQKEVDPFYNDMNGHMYVRASRFFHRIISGRRYIFELSANVDFRLIINN